MWAWSNSLRIFSGYLPNNNINGDEDFAPHVLSTHGIEVHTIYIYYMYIIYMCIYIYYTYIYIIIYICIYIYIIPVAVPAIHVGRMTKGVPTAPFWTTTHTTISLCRLVPTGGSEKL